MKQYYSLAEAAQILGYKNQTTLRVYIWKGLVKGEKFGRNWVITRKELYKRKRILERNNDKKALKLETAER